MKQFVRKADIILLIALVVLGLAASAVLAMHQNGDPAGASVVIRSGGRLYATYPLNEDRVLTVHASDNDDSYNIIRIGDGKVAVIEASCKNQVCVRHDSISLPGESIVCMPNRLVVSIESGKGGGYDSITS